MSLAHKLGHPLEGTHHRLVVLESFHIVSDEVHLHPKSPNVHGLSILRGGCLEVHLGKFLVVFGEGILGFFLQGLGFFGSLVGVVGHEFGVDFHLNDHVLDGWRGLSSCKH